MKYTPWPKRDPVKNYFQLPNEIFLLRLSPGALAVYSYLICCENRQTYQCSTSVTSISLKTAATVSVSSIMSRSSSRLSAFSSNLRTGPNAFLKVPALFLRYLPPL